MNSSERPLINVFISYSHDSEAHSNRVQTLAEQLRRSGINVEIDQYEPFPPQGWPLWMILQVRKADFVLMICTETYKRRFEGGEIAGTGKGARFEGCVVTQAIYDAECQNRKFLPTIFTS